MNPGGSIHKDSPVISIPSRINPVPRIDTYLFKAHSNIFFHLRLGLPKVSFPVGLPVKILKAATFRHSGYVTCPSQSSRFNHPEYTYAFKHNFSTMGGVIKICITLR